VATQAHAAHTAAALEALERKLANVEREGLRTRLHVSSLTTSASAEREEAAPGRAEDALAEAAAAGEPPPSDSESLQREQRAAEERFARYARTLEEERRDGAWAADMERRLRDLLAALQGTHLAKTRLERVDCRSTMCVAEFEHAEGKERERMPFLLQIEGLPRVSLLKQDEGGRSRTVAYLAKERLSTKPADPEL
jgi:hypothetical protein